MKTDDAPSIMITGGTGTFGNAAARLLLSSGKTSRVTIFSRDEQKQDVMRASLPDPEEKLRFFLGDVRDESRLRIAMRNVDVVVHAAAMKIVPLCEYDPSEAIKTNIMGAHNVVTASMACGVRSVIALSTDKAVSPANLYGATKLAAEKLFVAANNFSGHATKFSAVRYGNVAGSRGSIIPLWARLAAVGEALPLTDERMTRFWISVEEAVEFVLGAIECQIGGEVFIPKMPSFRLVDLAQAIWGEPTVPYQIIGVRPGEKVHEDLITVHEGRNVAQNERAYVICPPWMAPGEPVPEDFSVNSSKNDHWLSVADLRAKMGLNVKEE